VIRVAGPEDAGDVARLLVEFREWYGKPADDAVREQFDRTVRALIGRPDTEFLLGGGGDDPDAVAQVRYRLSVWTGTEDAWLEDLYVREAARGTGLGRAMVETVIERAQARGCGRLELDTDVSNTAARALYESVGFRDKSPGGTLFLQRML
jgi:ribosomal protein S18 acetylase RimI-like enzyme